MVLEEKKGRIRIEGAFISGAEITGHNVEIKGGVIGSKHLTEKDRKELDYMLQIKERMDKMKAERQAPQQAEQNVRTPRQGERVIKTPTGEIHIGGSSFISGSNIGGVAVEHGSRENLSPKMKKLLALAEELDEHFD
jgi:hypothetical protein